MELTNNRNMNLENKIMSELTKASINAEPVTITKNGIAKTGMRLIKGTLSPIVYYDPEDAFEDVMDRIRFAWESNPDFDADCIHDPDYILNNTTIALQRKSSEDFVKKDYLNLEAILKLQVNIGGDKGTIKLNDSLLKMNNLDPEEAWTWAVANSLNRFKITSMEEALGMPAGMMEAPFDVVTTSDNVDGAAALLFPELFWKYCHDRELTECLILPSSKEELLIVKDGFIDQFDSDLSQLAEMVNTINGSTVEPEIQLEPCVYRYDLMSNSISVIATADDAKSEVA